MPMMPAPTMLFTKLKPAPNNELSPVVTDALFLGRPSDAASTTEREAEEEGEPGTAKNGDTVTLIPEDIDMLLEDDMTNDFLDFLDLLQLQSYTSTEKPRTVMTQELRVRLYPFSTIVKILDFVKVTSLGHVTIQTFKYSSIKIITVVHNANYNNYIMLL
jgi:hypothetical protein